MAGHPRDPPPSSALRADAPPPEGEETPSPSTRDREPRRKKERVRPFRLGRTASFQANHNVTDVTGKVNLRPGTPKGIDHGRGRMPIGVDSYRYDRKRTDRSGQPFDVRGRRTVARHEKDIGPKRGELTLGNGLHVSCKQ